MKKLLPKSFKNPKGFTLVELLVVITIIAILAVVGIAALTSAQKTARDGRRRADVDSVAKAMESNYVPLSGTYAALSAGSFASNAIPKDPGTGVDYSANLTNSNKGFYVCATLENGNGNSSTSPTPPTTPTYSVNSGNTYYCKSSQQSQ